MADGDTPRPSIQRGIATRVLTTIGLFAAGFVAANVLQKPRSRVRGWFDRALRRLVFQSKRESARTEARSAGSLITELAAGIYHRFMTHNILSVAASSAFFLVLAIFPGLAALVALYGFLGDPADITTFLATMPAVVPGDVLGLLQGFLRELISRPRANLGTFLFSFSIAMWSANSGMKSLIEAMNVVYERRETRSFLRINVLAAIMTTAFLAFMIIAVNIMLLPISEWLRQELGSQLLSLRWLALLFGVQVLIAALYYFAPNGRQKNWQVLTAGAMLAALLWVAMSMLFSFYLTNFAHYSVTYGTLGAAAIFMTWLWLTVTTLLAGAEVDAAIENLGATAEVSDELPVA
ncbi:MULTISPECIES: YihY/virulence factor BrkB family protein [Rhodomicrobium]|uniref:YihY/virulence factor BrkB family protein n=1 Tax=Rhodomicrobium TaxID=1068 RepID=UPI000B4B87A6|nr:MULTISPECIES: YihY/virulence factor BrkB family protein [Rhodomicrobium]